MSQPDITLEDIQHRTEEVVRLGALGSQILGGPSGARIYLNDTLQYLLGVAIAQEGASGACELMERGLHMAEAFAQFNGCDDGRCAL